MARRKGVVAVAEQPKPPLRRAVDRMLEDWIKAHLDAQGVPNKDAIIEILRAEVYGSKDKPDVNLDAFMVEMRGMYQNTLKKVEAIERKQGQEQARLTGIAEKLAITGATLNALKDFAIAHGNSSEVIAMVARRLKELDRE